MRLELHWQILIGMVLGAVLGVAANKFLSQRTTELTSGLPAGVEQALVSDSTDLIQIRWTTTDQEQELRIVDPTGRTPNCVLTLEDLEAESPLAVEIYHLAPSYAHWIGSWCKRIGGLFLRLLQMVSVPLILTSLASGVLGLGGASRLGRMFSVTVGYYIATSTLAILTGLAMTNIFRPGIGTDLRLEAAKAQVGSTSIGELIMRQVETMIPTNPFAAIAESSFLSVISFTIVFSIFALQVGGRALENFKRLA
ncbi:MAG: cation:dicarboxylase symporter family transporter, partial [Planctomycetales bacterium]|nr:cation:dicarboxylase symporter family transporter [Planctomycetales bacterium]